MLFHLVGELLISEQSLPLNGSQQKISLRLNCLDKKDHQKIPVSKPSFSSMSPLRNNRAFSKLLLSVFGSRPKKFSFSFKTSDQRLTSANHNKKGPH